MEEPFKDIAIDPLYNKTEAAKYLDVQPSTMDQWRWNGRGPEFCKIGRNVRYRKSKLDGYLDLNSFKSTTESQQKAA